MTDRISHTVTLSVATGSTGVGRLDCVNSHAVPLQVVSGLSVWMGNELTHGRSWIVSVANQVRVYMIGSNDSPISPVDGREGNAYKPQGLTVAPDGPIAQVG